MRRFPLCLAFLLFSAPVTVTATGLVVVSARMAFGGTPVAPWQDQSVSTVNMVVGDKSSAVSLNIPTDLPSIMQGRLLAWVCNKGPSSVIVNLGMADVRVRASSPSLGAKVNPNEVLADKCRLLTLRAATNLAAVTKEGAANLIISVGSLLWRNGPPSEGMKMPFHYQH